VALALSEGAVHGRVQAERVVDSKGVPKQRAPVDGRQRMTVPECECERVERVGDCAALESPKDQGIHVDTTRSRARHAQYDLKSLNQERCRSERKNVVWPFSNLQRISRLTKSSANANAKDRITVKKHDVCSRRGNASPTLLLPCTRTRAARIILRLVAIRGARGGCVHICGLVAGRVLGAWWGTACERGLELAVGQMK
jgi:hypothetical protein